MWITRREIREVHSTSLYRIAPEGNPADAPIGTIPNLSMATSGQDFPERQRRKYHPAESDLISWWTCWMMPLAGRRHDQRRL